MTFGWVIQNSSGFLAFKRWWRRLREYRKALQLAIACYFLDRRQSNEPFDPALAKRVAVFRWDDKLGDTIMATLFVDALSKARPDIDIVYITGKQGRSLLQFWTPITQLVVVGRRGWKTAWGLRRIESGFDVVVELSSGMSAYELFALRQLRGRHYLGYQKQGYKLFDLNVADEHRHFAKRYLAAAALVAGKEVSGEFYLPDPGPAEDIVAQYVGAKPAGTHRVLINLFAAGKHRSFNMLDAYKFLNWWLETWPNVYIMLLTVPGRDAQLEELVARIGSARLDRTPGPPSIELTLAMIGAADLVVSPDTALVHMVAALDRPQIAIYRQQGPEFDAWHPVSKNTHVLFNKPATSRFDRPVAADFSWSDLQTKVNELLK